MKSSIKRLVADYFIKHWRVGSVVIILIITTQMSALVEPVILRRVVDVIGFHAVPYGSVPALYCFWIRSESTGATACAVR